MSTARGHTECAGCARVEVERTTWSESLSVRMDDEFCDRPSLSYQPEPPISILDAKNAGSVPACGTLMSRAPTSILIAVLLARLS